MLGTTPRTNMIICPCASMIDAAHLVNRFFSAKAKFFGFGEGRRCCEDGLAFHPAGTSAGSGQSNRSRPRPGTGAFFGQLRKMAGVVLATTKGRGCCGTNAREPAVVTTGSEDTRFEKSAAACGTIPRLCALVDSLVLTRHLDGESQRACRAPVVHGTGAGQRLEPECFGAEDRGPSTHSAGEGHLQLCRHANV